jgi:hypothetical protein
MSLAKIAKIAKEEKENDFVRDFLSGSTDLAVQKKVSGIISRTNHGEVA